MGAWGSKRNHFYGGNPNEKYSISKKRDTEPNDLDEMSEAEMEEVEAKIVQVKQLTELDEDDFLDTFASTTRNDKLEKNSDANSRLKKSDVPEGNFDLNSKIELDLSKLSQKERVQLFHRESPEFEGILADFQSKMTEASSRLQPIIDLLSDGKIPSNGPAAEFIKAKHQIILNYCTNIAAYFMFKTRRTNLKFHPITGRLVQYKQLLNRMDTVDKLVAPQVDRILVAVSQKSDAKGDKEKENKDTEKSRVPNYKMLDI